MNDLEMLATAERGQYLNLRGMQTPVIMKASQVIPVSAPEDSEHI